MRRRDRGFFTWLTIFLIYFYAGRMGRCDWMEGKEIRELNNIKWMYFSCMVLFVKNFSENQFLNLFIFCSIFLSTVTSYDDTIKFLFMVVLRKILQCDEKKGKSMKRLSKESGFGECEECPVEKCVARITENHFNGSWNIWGGNSTSYLLYVGV